MILSMIYLFTPKIDCLKFLVSVVKRNGILPFNFIISFPPNLRISNRNLIKSFKLSRCIEDSYDKNFLPNFIYFINPSRIFENRISKEKILIKWNNGKRPGG